MVGTKPFVLEKSIVIVQEYFGFLKGFLNRSIRNLWLWVIVENGTANRRLHSETNPSCCPWVLCPISTPLIIDKRRNFTHPRNYEQLQISNEPFYQQRNEDEFFESPLTEEEKQESKQVENIEHQEQPSPPEIQKPPPTIPNGSTLKWVEMVRSHLCLWQDIVWPYTKV